MTHRSGAAITDGDPVLLATSNYLATGGDGILGPVMPAEGFPVDAGAPLVRDVIVDYLRRPGTPVSEAQLVDATPRLSVAGPLPCDAR